MLVCRSAVTLNDKSIDRSALRLSVCGCEMRADVSRVGLTVASEGIACFRW